MSKFKAMKFWIGDDPELSKKVQEILFDLGYRWHAGKHARNLNGSAIFAENDGYIDWCCTRQTFIDEPREEINIDWMRSTKPETIEFNGKTYIKSELEEALRKIKPVGE